MAGFDNDVMYSTNVDFTGSFPVTGQVTMDGQLLIGAAVAPFIRANTLTAGTGIAITNGAGTITISNTGGGGGGGGATSLSGNVGSAPNIAGVINVIGATGITTTGDGVQTLTITPTGNLAALFGLSGTGYVVRTGVSTFIERTFVAGSGISLLNADGVAAATTISASPIVPTTFTEDVGSAIPAANNINIFGTAAQGISTSGAGSTVTITAANASAVQKGVATFDATNFTVAAGNVTSNALTVTAGVGLDTGGSVNLGGSVTLDLEVPVTVPNGGTGRITLTDNGVLYGDIVAPVGMTAAGTDGQVLIAATGLPPAFATISGTQGVTLTGGPNTLSIGLVNVPNSALANSSITVIGGAGITVVGSPVSLGGAVTISASGTIVTQFSADSGVAVPSGNNINLLGTASQGVSTSAAGSTVTFTVADATTTTKGVASFNPADFTVSSGAVSLIPIAMSETLTPDTGGAVSPTANNINVLGQDFGSFSLMDTHNTGSSTLRVENRTWLTPLVVDSSATVGARGTFSTIAAAITAASAGQTIFIRPGTYTENLTLKVGVNLTAFMGDADTPNVTIIGKCTLTTAGTVTISNIRLQTNSDFAIAVTGSAASILKVKNCYLNCTNNTFLTYTSSSSSSLVLFDNCRGDITTTGIALFAMTSAGNLKYFYCIFENTGGSTTANTISANTVELMYTRFFNPITSSGTAQLALRFSEIYCKDISTTALTVGGSGDGDAFFCRFEGNTASAVSISTEYNLRSCDIGSANADSIAGSGTVRYNGLTFTNGSNGTLANTLNKDALFSGPRFHMGAGPEVLAGSGSPVGNASADQGSIYLRSNGSSSSTRAYINTNGATAWTNITTAS